MNPQSQTGFHPLHPTAAHDRTTNAARIVVALLSLRWLAGIGENLGGPPVSEPTAALMLAVLAVLFLHRMTIAAPATLLLVGLLFWVLTGALSYLANDVPARREALALLGLLGLYGLFANACFSYIRGNRTLELVALFLRAFILIGSLLAIWQIASGTGFVAVGKSLAQRAIGSDVHPVSFAIELVAAVTAMECIRLRLGRGVGLGHVVLVSLAMIALYLTLARTAWVMAGIISGFAIWSRASYLGRISMVILGVPMVLSVLTLSGRFADLGSLGHFLSAVSLDNLVFDYRYIDNSISWRIVNWGYGVRQVMDAPLLGFGPGQSATASFFNLEMHNIFLESLFEGGVLGLSALLLTLAGFVYIHRQLPRTSAIDRRIRALVNGFGFSLLLAVTFSTSLVDQLMSVLLYILLLAVGLGGGARPVG